MKSLIDNILKSTYKVNVDFKRGNATFYRNNKDTIVLENVNQEIAKEIVKKMVEISIREQK